MTIDRITVDEMSLGNILVNKVIVEKMAVGKIIMTKCLQSQRPSKCRQNDYKNIKSKITLVEMSVDELSENQMTLY